MTSLIPHPVLVSNGNDYKEESSFSMEIDSNQLTIDGKIRITAQFTLKSRFIQRLLEKKHARFCVLIRCSRTYKRHIYQTPTTELSLNLPLAEYADEIKVEPFIVSTKDIEYFKSAEHNREFLGIPIKVPAGAILAIGGGHKFTVDSLATLSAAIKLVTRNELEDGEYMIDVSDDHIEIQLNADTYHKVNSKRKTGILYPTLFLSALTHAIMHVDENSKVFCFLKLIVRKNGDACAK